MADKKLVDQYIEYHTGKEWVNKSTINTDEQELRNAEGDFLGNMSNIIRDLRAVLFGSASELDQENINVERPKKDAKPNKKGEYKQKDLETTTKLAWGPTKVVKTVGKDHSHGRKDGEVFSRYTTTPLGDGRVIVGRYHEEGKRQDAAAIHMFVLPAGTTLTSEQIENLPFLDNDKIKEVGEKEKLEKLDADSLNIKTSTPTPPTSSTEKPKSNTVRSVEQIYATIYLKDFLRFLEKNPKLKKDGKGDKALSSFIKEEKKSKDIYDKRLQVAKDYSDKDLLYAVSSAAKEQIDYSFILKGGHRNDYYAPSKSFENLNLNPKILFSAQYGLAPEDQIQEVRDIKLRLDRYKDKEAKGALIPQTSPAEIYSNILYQNFKVFLKETDVKDPNLAKALFYVFSKNNKNELDQRALNISEASVENLPLKLSPKSKEISKFIKANSAEFDSFKKSTDFADKDQAMVAFYYNKNYDKEFTKQEEIVEETPEPQPEPQPEPPTPEPEKKEAPKTPPVEKPAEVRSAEQIYADIYYQDFQKYLKDNPKIQKKEQKDQAADFIKKQEKLYKKDKKEFEKRRAVAESYRDLETIYETKAGNIVESVDKLFEIRNGETAGYTQTEEFSKAHNNINPKLLFCAENGLATEEEINRAATAPEEHHEDHTEDHVEEKPEEHVEEPRTPPVSTEEEVETPEDVSEEETEEVAETPSAGLYHDQSGVDYYYLPYKNGEAQDMLRLIQRDGKTYINIAGLDGQEGVQTCEINDIGTKEVDGKQICSLQVTRNDKKYDLGLPIDISANEGFYADIQSLVHYNDLKATELTEPPEIKNPTYNSKLSTEIATEHETEITSTTTSGKNLQEISISEANILGENVSVASQTILLRNAATKTDLPPQTLSVIDNENILVSVSRNGNPVVVVTKDEESKMQARISKEFADTLEPKDKLGLGDAIDGYYTVPIDKLKFSETKGLEAAEVRGAGEECAFLISAINAQFKDKEGNAAGMRGIDIEKGTGKAFDIAISTEFMKMSAKHENGCELEGKAVRDAALVAQSTLARKTSIGFDNKTIGINTGDGYIYSVPIKQNGEMSYANIKVGLDGSTSMYMQLGEGKGRTQPKFETITSAALRADSSRGAKPQLVLEISSGTASKKMIKVDMNDFKDNSELIDLLSGRLPEADHAGNDFFKVTDNKNNETESIGAIDVGKTRHQIYPRTNEAFADLTNVANVANLTSNVTENDITPTAPATPDIPDPVVKQKEGPGGPGPGPGPGSVDPPPEKEEKDSPAKKATGGLLLGLGLLFVAISVFIPFFNVFAAIALGFGCAAEIGLIDALLDPLRALAKRKAKAKEKAKKREKTREKHREKHREKVDKIKKTTKGKRQERKIYKENLRRIKEEKNEKLKEAKARNKEAQNDLKAAKKAYEKANKAYEKAKNKHTENEASRKAALEAATAKRDAANERLKNANSALTEAKKAREAFNMTNNGVFLIRYNKKQEALKAREEAQGKLNQVLPQDKTVEFAENQLKTVNEDFIKQHNAEQSAKKNVKKKLPQIKSVEELQDILNNKDGKYNSNNYERTRKLYEKMVQEREQAKAEAEKLEKHQTN